MAKGWVVPFMHPIDTGVNVFHTLFQSGEF